MDKGHHDEDIQPMERQDKAYLTQRIVVGRSLVVEDKLVEVEGKVTARGRGDTDSGRRAQVGNLLERERGNLLERERSNLLERERGNLPELEDRWGREYHCRQGAEELRGSQNRTFPFLLSL